MLKKIDKVMQIQKQVRENTRVCQNYLTDLQNWEAEMKRKEAALNGGLEQEQLPPVRSKIKRGKVVPLKQKAEKRISSSDYQAWEKFDVDKACEEVDMEGIGPVSLDAKNSETEKQKKLREEAQYEKERGNTFVKQEKWDEAISCYNRAIELVKDDAIYFANRALCYLKKDSLHQAESDCSEALRLDPSYVKALQRRASARERLGSLRAASQDLNDVIKLEPHNNAARKQLAAVKARMGTKGTKSKSSPIHTPTSENKPLLSMNNKVTPKIVELPDEPSKVVESNNDKWSDGTEETVNVIKPVRKPPHLRSKRAMKTIPIEEIPLGTSSSKPPTRLKIIEIEDNQAHGDTINNNSDKDGAPEILNKGEGDKKLTSPESIKLMSDALIAEKTANDMTPPQNSVQFMSEWNYLSESPAARSEYLSIIDPKKIPAIFENALESFVLSELLRTLNSNPHKFAAHTVTAYLKGLTGVKRFYALAMFLSKADKELITTLLEHCKNVENCSDEDIAELKIKYEI